MVNHQRLQCLLLLILITLSPSCRNEDSSGKNRLIYFNLTDFIEGESKRLSASEIKVDKTVFLNGKKENKSVQVSDWNNELNAFKEADINKKSFLGKYQVDSMDDANGRVIIYKALDPDFRTKELTVGFNPDHKPVKVTAKVSTSNVLYSSYHNLLYMPEQGFLINGKQTVRFLEPDSFSVAVSFNNP